MNFSVGVADERHDHHGHMNHWFLSMAVLYNTPFVSCPDVPQIALRNLRLADLMLSKDEYKLLRADVIRKVSSVMAERIPQLAHLKLNAKVNADEHFEKTHVIRLPAWPLNEQKYQDVVKILEGYQTLVEEIHENVTSEEQKLNVNIGGDQLTRERFSHAKLLRLGNTNKCDNFDLLSPVTFEFFHLAMNFLETVIFKRLYSDKSDMEVGTMQSVAGRLGRKDINPDVIKAYNADKDFFLSLYRAYIVEALLEHLNMTDVNDVPEDVPSPGCDDVTTQAWIEKNLGSFVDNIIDPDWCGRAEEKQTQYGTSTIHESFEIQLPGGNVIHVTVPRKEVVFGPMVPDKIKDYGHQVLELGTMYQHLVDLCKCPNREKVLALLKMLMITLKCNNNRSKYSLEILRFLVQQYSLLPEKEARQTFHQLFVNTRGNFNSHIPCDLAMEWQVRDEKRHLKHMFSNKTSTNILARSSALGGIEKISKNFDEQANVRLRSKRHNHVSALADEIRIIEDLRSVRPFSHSPGRKYSRFPRINSSVLKSFDGFKFRAWYEKHKYLFNA